METSGLPDSDPPAELGPVSVVQRRGLRDGVYDAILEMLLDGRATPGTSLAIDGLARLLGVSPTPIREALGLLEHTGLVTRAALKGYRVAPPLTPEKMVELMDARMVIEVAATRRAVPVEPDIIGDLELAHAKHQQAAVAVRTMARDHPGQPEWSTLREYYTCDWEFHLVLLRNCHNDYLLAIAQGLSPYVHRLRQSMHFGAIDVEQAVGEHATILAAVRSGNADAAAEAMTGHLAAVRSRALADG